MADYQVSNPMSGPMENPLSISVLIYISFKIEKWFYLDHIVKGGLSIIKG